jgi:hypothetical protein
MESAQRMQRLLKVFEDRLLAQAIAERGLGPSVAGLQRLASEIHEHAVRLVELTAEPTNA